MNYIFLVLFDRLFPCPPQWYRAVALNTAPTPLPANPTTGARDGFHDALTLTRACA